MVDFKKLRESKAKPTPINPREIFNALPKPPGINDLYASQAEVLDGWFGQRSNKDIVVKLPTGGGKTLVALLMAQSAMNELNEPVVYLAPTNQLVQQVIAKSVEYGIKAMPYPAGRGTPLPSEFLDGKAVLVGSYESLFNGRSKFGVRGSGRTIAKAGTIILDDAHVALSSVRDAFSLDISSQKHADIYAELAGRFRPAFLEVGRAATFADFTRGKDYGVIEVPSWAWLEQVPELTEYLAKHVDTVNPYVWPLLRDNLGICHCLFSRSSITITPILPPVDLLPTFQDCPRRIYMSATIADDSEIVRTFGAASDAIEKPLTSASLAGVGERMILVPEQMKLGGTAITPLTKQIAKGIANGGKGVVILSPSGKAAQAWTDIAAYPDTTTAVADKVKAMQEGKTFGPVVLANRYDGIDLSGNACRLLVMDDLPQGTSNYDLFRMEVVADSAVNSLLAQRIEQGVGRGTRGGSDYCVVLLVGNKLAGWIGRRKNLTHLTASTRAQLKMGQEVSEAVTAVKELSQTIQNCLNRDPEWIRYHASELSEAAHGAPPDLAALKMAAAERRAFRQQSLGQFAGALATLEKARSDKDIAADAQRQAWLSYLAARIAYQSGDKDRAQKLQTEAFAVNFNHSPPKVRPNYTVRPIPSKQSEAIVTKLLEYERRQSLIADFNEAVSNLVPDASANRYEQALLELGNYLGFECERPEKTYGVGPDVLWRTDGEFDFVIEAKSEKDSGNPLYKKDHAQLLEAENWFREKYPNRGSQRVSALPEAIADEKVTPIGTYAFRLDDISKLVGALRGLLTELVESTGDAAVLRERCEVALEKAKLKPASIRSTFMQPFGKLSQKTT